MLKLPPLSLYIHLPWCVRRCPYCDFNAHALKGTLPEKEYIDALLADLEADLPRVWGREVVSIFLGGGTPSLFSAQGLDRLLSHVRACFRLKPDAEITIEANPGTIERGQFSDYAKIGINRVSLGVQSFNAIHLKRLGRIHDPASAILAIEELKASGIQNFNLDLMHGLPSQTKAEALQDLKTAISFEPNHLSWYQLTLEPNTLFGVEQPALPDEEVLESIEEEGLSALSEAGFLRYEVSAYAREKRVSDHNLNYWLFGDYLGIGAGAHSKITDLSTETVWRFSKQKHPKLYLDPTLPRIQTEEKIEPAELPFEFMLNALRLPGGVDVSCFEHYTGLQLSVIEPILNRAREQGLLEYSTLRIQPTARGIRYLNDVLLLFRPN